MSTGYSPYSPMMQAPFQNPDLGQLSPALSGAVAAPPGRRFAALVLDGVVSILLVYVPGLIAYLFVPSWIVLMCVALIVDIVIWGVYAQTGYTPGKAMMKTRVVSATTGGRPGFGITFCRGLLYGIGVIPIYIGTIIGASQISSNIMTRRAWWDTACGAVVIDARGYDPMRQPRPAAMVAAAPMPTASAPMMQDPGYAWPPTPVQPATTQPAVAQPAPVTEVLPVVQTPPAPTPPAPAAPQAPTAPHSPAAAKRRLITSVPGFDPAPEAPQPDADDMELTHVQSRVPTINHLVFDDGMTVALTGATALIGRNPHPAPGTQVDQLITIPDTTKSVSKTHLEIGTDGAMHYVADVGSTNGSAVIDANGIRTRLTPGRRVVISPTDTVTIGDRHFQLVED